MSPPALSRPTAIYWVRRDLRIADNPMLLAAAQAGELVCPVYIRSTWRETHAWTGPNRQQFLCDSLAALSAGMARLGGRLLVRSGDPVAVLERLIAETGATSVVFQQDPDPHGQAVERAVATRCRRLGVAVQAIHDVSLHPPEAVLTGDQRPYRVFTPYWNNWRAQAKAPPLPAPPALHSPAGLFSEPLPTLDTWSLPPCQAAILPGGEAAAVKRLQTALDTKLGTYETTRDLPALAGTSRLSQDLRFGLLSLRSVYAGVMAAHAAAAPGEKPSVLAFLRELAWREFYFAILRHFPEVLDHEFAPQWRGLPWAEPDAKLTAWQLGRTGFPIVDAGMRELLATGHLHNRVRMITAMFLTKDLHFDWRLGEAWFMRHLVDGEIASNNGGWQWSAGTGADAAPYFRIQNPWSQTARYDPQGIYIKRWLPELAKVPAGQLLKPPANQRPLAPDYPLPIVDHAAERLRTLALFQRHQANQR
jgi:deoxyribodipyrimidine photo-lyase